VTAEPPTPVAATPAPQLAAPPLLYVDVAISAGHSERVPLWRDTDCGDVAAAFAQKHALAPKVATKLARLLEAQRTAILSAGGS